MCPMTWAFECHHSTDPTGPFPLTAGEQRSKRTGYSPGLATLDLIGCWALTEPGQGSDAAAMETTATKVSLKAWAPSRLPFSIQTYP